MVITTTIIRMMMVPEVIEAGEVSSLPGGAEYPEDVLGAVQVDEQAQAVVWLLRGNVRSQ